jgi:SRSO17 transposase
MENCQVGVFLAHATRRGQALLDCALYLPKDENAGRRAESGVSKCIEFATKPALAHRMIDRAVVTGVPERWMTADAVYRSDPLPVRRREARSGYVGQVRLDLAMWAGFRKGRGGLAGVPADAWHRLSCGGRGMRPRVYDWALPRTNSPEPREYARWLLFRRSVSDRAEVSYFAHGGTAPTTLNNLVRVAGTRWEIEDLLKLAKATAAWSRR